ncbi:hypothetical protein GALMADRAFT_1040906 [Galerina marginata CBS 339.88]|uniref:WW domain-containing protein n=1 Tax=Galerina marginata (strain CBS 339.88) TaxID=685588 RepID=A0A067SBV6_GALM3|nr:hypothetical protein GALMADRAFT_1040906 [Galerina marginata CBS 339.88]
MEEDAELLDWGHEEDENQGAFRRASSGQNGRRDYTDVDDVEDTVSLGEDEDDQGYFYQREDAIRSAKDTGIALEVPERPRSPRRREDALGANDQQSTQYSFAEGEGVDRSAAETPTRSTDSPPSQRAAANHSSPQRSNHNGARLTHALPAKPVTVPAAYLPLPHPSVVEAVGMASISPGRTTGRDTKKLNGAPGSSPAGADLPQHWEQRFSRKDGNPYYYNRETFESTRDHPVSSIPSTSSFGETQTRRRSVSSGKIHMTPLDSNTYHSQASRSNRERPHPQPDTDTEDANKGLDLDPDGHLSYKDRHYRPGGDISSASVEIRPVEHIESLSSRLPSKSRYERSPSPPSRRRRARSNSPPPDTRESQIRLRDRDNHSSRGNGRPARDKNVYTDPNSDILRDNELAPPEPDRHWKASQRMPPTDFSNDERSSRRPPHRPIDEDVQMFDQRNHSDNRNRPNLKRRESSREPRDRGREPPRPADRRERPDDQQSFISTPRYRSPRPRERDPGREYGPPQEPAAYSGSAPTNRRDRDRPSRAELPSNGSSASVNRPARETANPRPRDYDNVQPSNYEQSRRDRRDDRDHHRDPGQDDSHLPRRPDGYPPVETNRPSNERPSNERPKRFQNDYEQPRPDESSQRRRPPLPPQAKTFLSSSTSGPVYRDPPPHHTQQDWPNKDAEPKWPKRGPNSSRDEEPPRHQDRGQNDYTVPQLPPRIDTRMDVAYNGEPKSSVYTSPYEKPRNLDTPRGEHLEPSGGPRSGRPRESPNSARPVSPNVPSQRNENPRYERGPPAGLPPPPPAANFDDRRAQENRSEPRSGWRDSRQGAEARISNST